MIKFKHSYPYYYIIPPPVSSAKDYLVFSLNIFFIMCSRIKRRKHAVGVSILD